MCLTIGTFLQVIEPMHVSIVANLTMASPSALSLSIKQELSGIRLPSLRPAVVVGIGAVEAMVDVVVRVVDAVMVTKPTTVGSGKAMTKLHRPSLLQVALGNTRASGA